MPDLCDHCFTVKTWSIHRVQESHTLLLHLLWDQVHVAMERTTVSYSERPFGNAPCRAPAPQEILLGTGSGGKLTARLIEKIILPAFRNPAARAARRPGHPVVWRRPAGLHHRLLRGDAHLLPGG